LKPVFKGMTAEDEAQSDERYNYSTFFGFHRRKQSRKKSSESLEHREGWNSPK
jgi:hypothetical protein